MSVILSRQVLNLQTPQRNRE